MTPVEAARIDRSQIPAHQKQCRTCEHVEAYGRAGERCTEIPERNFASSYFKCQGRHWKMNPAYAQEFYISPTLGG